MPKNNFKSIKNHIIVKIRPALFTNAETFLNHYYGISEWACLDQESEKSVQGARAICVSQTPIGLRLFSQKHEPYQFAVHALVVKDKEESTVTLSAHTIAEKKTPIINLGEHLEEGTNARRNPKIDPILRDYLGHLMTVVGEHASLLEPKMDYTSFTKGDTTYVRYEILSKPSSTKIVIPVPWPGEDPHSLRLEEMGADSVSQRFVFSFCVAV